MTSKLFHLLQHSSSEKTLTQSSENIHFFWTGIFVFIIAPVPHYMWKYFGLEHSDKTGVKLFEGGHLRIVDSNVELH